MDEWEEVEPRVIASGRWEQNEYGDTTYIPDHIRPSTAEIEQGAGGGYRIRSDQVWAAARDDYLAGDTAEAVCERHGLKLGTLRARAAREGWRRSDAPDPEPLEIDIGAAPPDLSAMARHALARAERAIQRGRAAEAASWLRTWRALTDPALTLTESEPEPEPEPDPLDAVERDAAEIGDLARDAAELNLRDPAARAALETRLAALKARMTPEGNSDDSDSVLSELPSPSREEGSGMGAAAPKPPD